MFETLSCFQSPQTTVPSTELPVEDLFGATEFPTDDGQESLLTDGGPIDD